MEQEFITDYFKRGYSYIEILFALKDLHQICISERTLHRILRQHGLYRKGLTSSTISVIHFVKNELKGSGSCLGYRTMHQRCVRTGLRVSQNVANVTLRALDPEPSKQLPVPSQ